ncbi:MAG: hypothetical protein IKP74_08625 [Clostridia bacterium]|nr:hypothetical protein [Clostridia bacterium]
MKTKTATGSLLSTLFGSSSGTATEKLSKRSEGKTRAKTYREWLKENALPDGGELQKASVARAKGSPDYGAGAERLSDRGLSGSGYADWLREKNEGEYRRAIARAREKTAASGPASRKGYLKYLSEWETGQDELMQSTLSRLSSIRVQGATDAYADALSAGLTVDRARLVAKIAPALGKYGARRLRQGLSGLLAVSLSANLSGGDAERLARAYGFSAEDAKKLRETVETAPDGATFDPDEWAWK